MAFLAVVFLVPLAQMALRSVTPDPGHYLVFARSSVYVSVLETTFRTAATVTTVCLVVGYPYAYVMHRAGPRLTALLTAAVLLPFWSSVLVRTYAWTVLLQDVGVVNSLLRGAGLTDDPIPLMRNTLGVVIGMTHVLLPFMVLPLYAVMRRIDPQLTLAAASLGAGPFAAFRRVFLPLSLPGVVAGSLLVFVLSLGFYVTPAILGDPRNAMFSELIVEKVSRDLDFGAGSAMAMVLLTLTLAVLWLGSRVVGFARLVGYEGR